MKEKETPRKKAWKFFRIFCLSVIGYDATGRLINQLEQKGVFSGPLYFSLLMVFTLCLCASFACILEIYFIGQKSLKVLREC